MIIIDKIFCYDTDDVTIISHVTQWDINRKIHIKKDDIGVTTVAPEVHFANNNTCKALVTTSSIVGESVEVEIPNILLRERLPIMMYIYVWTDSTSARTKYEIKMPVNPRQKPEDYIFDDNVLYVIGVPRDGSITEDKLSSDLFSTINGKLDKSYFDSHTNKTLVFNNEDLMPEAAILSFSISGSTVDINLFITQEKIDFQFPNISTMNARLSSFRVWIGSDEDKELLTIPYEQLTHLFDDVEGFQEYKGDGWKEATDDDLHYISYDMRYSFDTVQHAQNAYHMLVDEATIQGCDIIIQGSVEHIVREVE